MGRRPGFPILVPHVGCKWCASVADIDVCSHPWKFPGFWVCPCGRLYDRDATEARLVEIAGQLLLAWHSQDIVCPKCLACKNSNITTFCMCSGYYATKHKVRRIPLILKVMESLVEPHGLPWLGE